jgi:hypothetical protein
MYDIIWPPESLRLTIALLERGIWTAETAVHKATISYVIPENLSEHGQNMAINTHGPPVLTHGHAP